MLSSKDATDDILFTKFNKTVCVQINFSQKKKKRTFPCYWQLDCESLEVKPPILDTSGLGELTLTTKNIFKSKVQFPPNSQVIKANEKQCSHRVYISVSYIGKVF